MGVLNVSIPISAASHTTSKSNFSSCITASNIFKATCAITAGIIVWKIKERLDNRRFKEIKNEVVAIKRQLTKLESLCKINFDELKESQVAIRKEQQEQTKMLSIIYRILSPLDPNPYDKKSQGSTFFSRLTSFISYGQQSRT